MLDPAILRPGRFDRRITVPRPDVRGREEILRVHAKRTPLAPDVDLEIIARGTPGFSGADLENLVNEAALLAARQDKDAVDMVDFELAKDKVYMGTERRSMVISDEEKRTTAVHEAGHTLIAVLISHHDPVHKVTIIPRGPALGVTWYLPKDDRHNLSKEQAESAIAVALGGRIAEEIIFGQLTTGAGNDIEKATEIARKMVCEWGMSEKLGPLAYGKKEESIFLGRDYGSATQDYSEQTAQEIDQEVRGIVQRQYEKVKDLLGENREQARALADALIERETLDAEEIRAVARGARAPAGASGSSSRRTPTRTRRRRRSARSRASSAARRSPPRAAENASKARLRRARFASANRALRVQRSSSPLNQTLLIGPAQLGGRVVSRAPIVRALAPVAPRSYVPPRTFRREHLKWPRRSPSTASAVSVAASSARMAERKVNDLEVVAINDLDRREDARPPLQLRHRPRPREAPRRRRSRARSTSAAATTKVVAEKDPAKLPWKELGVDIVLESHRASSPTRRRPRRTCTRAPRRSSSARRPRATTRRSSSASTPRSTTPPSTTSSPAARARRTASRPSRRCCSTPSASSAA